MMSLALGAGIAQDLNFISSSGTIQFRSVAPLETISATSRKLAGVIDAEALTFAFSVPIRSFDGFNNGLQKQHFYENYMEADKYPDATFTGKIIEHIDLSQPGTYQVRAKGQLTIHGRTKERIIKTDIVSTGTELKAKTSFSIPLMDHQIEVPRIVNQKIAREIDVTIQAIFQLAGKS
jgi:polyisoprenoid-binding protein YceI